MDIRVIEREEMKVVGIPWNGTYAQMDQIPFLFARMKQRSDEVLFQRNQNIFIAPFHGRETELTYYVTVPVEEITYIPEGMTGFTIPEKNYVFCTHNGMAAEIEHTYQRIEAWMEEYGYEQDNQALSLEVYNSNINEIDFSDELIKFEIYIPVKKYSKIQYKYNF
ncbi:GyrI-like domain-containing protein [Neobacillus sp. PS3-12]|uniref:GyrI-like domain-containing protein n=1 Tax=Neobacillus sp. PS3-12 TaxID=3070677 RepID=UPI0027E1D6C5|nr:GyrI-like domain-containing protein [Neobacillus sp. PS3-12]WML52828.1 GyrI-like domain-containing protein [Neobacillus sp. PS3-12]